jgi:8-oxo-dGTP pyrophosphatase MutT (NUDIX family)
VAFAFGAELREHIRANLASVEPARLSPDGLRRAAVGVVLLPDGQGHACFVLTRRLATLRRHSGQWALPGGRLDPGETPVAAALREVHEEVGIEVDPTGVLGRLDDFLTRSGHLISPFVVWAPSAEDALHANPEEVDAAYRVTLDDLDQSDSVGFEPLLHFNLLGTTIFAPTAAILYQFREVAVHGRPVHLGHVEQPFFAWS